MKSPSPKRLFLLDGLGALVSTFFLGYVLIQYEPYFGMPVKMLQLLALLAFILAIFSLTCFFRTPKKWGIYLQMIGKANFAYSIVTLILVVHHFDKLTWLGVAYFVAELLILLVLIRVELKGSIK